ncbi:MAG: hypothetical protein WC848_05755 [Parcubacteria group bacterium]|jgi:hypothetical protein
MDIKEPKQKPQEQISQEFTPEKYTQDELNRMLDDLRGREKQIMPVIEEMRLQVETLNKQKRETEKQQQRLIIEWSYVKDSVAKSRESHTLNTSQLEEQLSQLRAKQAEDILAIENKIQQTRIRTEERLGKKEELQSMKISRLKFWKRKKEKAQRDESLTEFKKFSEEDSKLLQSYENKLSEIKLAHKTQEEPLITTIAQERELGITEEQKENSFKQKCAELSQTSSELSVKIGEISNECNKLKPQLRVVTDKIRILEKEQAYRDKPKKKYEAIPPAPEDKDEARRLIQELQNMGRNDILDYIKMNRWEDAYQERVVGRISEIEKNHNQYDDYCEELRRNIWSNFSQGYLHELFRVQTFLNGYFSDSSESTVNPKTRQLREMINKRVDWLRIVFERAEVGIKTMEIFEVPSKEFITALPSRMIYMIDLSITKIPEAKKQVLSKYDNGNFLNFVVQLDCAGISISTRHDEINTEPKPNLLNPSDWMRNY